MIFLEQYETELTIFFCLLSGAHRPHCPKATKLTHVWCNLKKQTIQLLKMMHEQRYKACLSQSISATKNKEMVISFFEITKLLTKIISHLSLLSTYVRKKQKNMLALLHIK